MSTVYLNIGSNKGDRHALIGRAVALLGARLGAEARCSRWYHSEPWGFISDAMFVNLGVAIDIDGDTDPMRLLDLTQEIERELGGGPHRTPDGSYIDRALDIDIIAIDRVVMATDRLTLPHPLSWARDFVMQPMRQIAPADLVDWLIATNRGQSAAR